MRHQTILRLLSAGFLLYIAWPYIPDAVLPLERAFWGAWLLFFSLVIAANFATLLRLSRPPVMEQQYETSELERRRQR